VQSFDWRTIRYTRQLNPGISTVALVWQYGPAECRTLADECSLRASYGDPSVRSRGRVASTRGGSGISVR
jgi:glycerophosphoryl diester phosphodiesterase